MSRLAAWKSKVDWRVAVILLSATLLPTAYRCFGSQSFFDAHWAPLFGGSTIVPMYAVLYVWLILFVLFFVVPAAVARLGLKLRLSDLGLRLGNVRKGLIRLAILLPIAALLLLPTARMPEFRATYPLYHAAGQSLSVFILYELCYAAYYFGWEFFFRGFMLFGLVDAFGAVNAVRIQTIPSTLAHIGKPTPEIIAAVAAGLAFGAIALRTRSILYVFLLHWLIGVMLDVFIILGPH